MELGNHKDCNYLYWQCNNLANDKISLCPLGAVVFKKQLTLQFRPTSKLGNKSGSQELFSVGHEPFPKMAVDQFQQFFRQNSKKYTVLTLYTTIIQLNNQMFRF